MIQCGPYHGTHATAGTFAFKRELLEQTQYEETAAIAEERAFLKGYTIPFIQLDPLKTILVFSHDHNTFDKKRMFDGNPDPKYFKESEKTVDMFITNDYEKKIKQFFMNDIDELLAKYKDGLPIMKPDVLQQIKEIEAEREKEKQQAIANLQYTNISIHQEGHPPKKLTTNQVITLIQNQQKTIHDQKQTIDKLNARGIITENNKGETKKLLSLEEIVSIITELKDNVVQLTNKNQNLEKVISNSNDQNLENVISNSNDQNLENVISNSNSNMRPLLSKIMDYDVIITKLKEDITIMAEEKKSLNNYINELQEDIIKLTQNVKDLTMKKE